MISYDSIIIGGGFFGLYLSEYLAKQGLSVLLCEKENDVMQRASYVNQARVHNGYHYPRSVLTALRSKMSFPVFVNEFKHCVDDAFRKYYMIGRLLGKVTASQFERFCRRIDIPCTPASSQIVGLTDPRMVEAVFETTEYAFDASKLKDTMLDRISSKNVTVRRNTMVKSVKQIESGIIAVDVENTQIPQETETLQARHVFNCTYSQINRVTKNSGLPIIPLKHELTEMCLVDVPDEFKDVGLTIMCGPFFSVMPFPARGLHSFSHVRYTPHCEWHDGESSLSDESCFLFSKPGRPGIDPHCRSAWNKMIRDAVRYIPRLADCRYKESIWEIKTLLPRSETDDSRPILFKPNYGMNGFHCIMGGKIDNVYDVENVINKSGVVTCQENLIPIHSFPSSEYSTLPKTA